MKKILTFLVALVIGLNLSFAQADKKAAPKAAPKGTTAQKEPAKTTDKPAAGPTKKDGTPDMRYKENKEAAKPAPGPTKKDGTPDMRYKANKDAAAKDKPAPEKKK